MIQADVQQPPHIAQRSHLFVVKQGRKRILGANEILLFAEDAPEAFLYQVAG